MRITSSYFHLISALAVIALLLGFVVWANGWYSSAGNQDKFTPGDIGSAFNIVNVLITCVIAYYARLAFSSSQQQLVEMQKDRRSQQFTDMVTQALQQFKQRKESKGDVFLEAFNSTHAYSPADSSKLKENRRSNFRTANYILKPLAYCCNWMLAHDWSEVDDDFSKVMEMNALRILGGLTSAEHVFLLMATKLEINQIKLTYHVYERCYDSHIPIYELLTIYAPKELWDCEAGNPGQMKKIDEMIENLGWKESAQVREQFFTCDVKS